LINPLKIKVENQQYLNILWEDNLESKIELQTLRSACPCAVCTTGKDPNKDNLPFQSLKIGGELEIADIKLVGNYALNIFWKDGHNTGIYEFTLLRRLGK
jgi:DUF971 family protein